MAYPNTGSILDSKTRTGLSTQIIITCSGVPIGAVQEFSVSQSRSNKRITEVGTDGTIEIVPQAPAEVSLRVNRVVFDGLTLPEAMARGFQNIKSQRLAFDLVVIDNYLGVGENATITTYRNCWFNSIETTYSSGDYIIMQNAGIDVEDVQSLRGGEAVALSSGLSDAREVPAQLDDVELSTDSGARHGSLDAGGLISAAFS